MFDPRLTDEMKFKFANQYSSRPEISIIKITILHVNLAIEAEHVTLCTSCKRFHPDEGESDGKKKVKILIPGNSEKKEFEIIAVSNC